MACRKCGYIEQNESVIFGSSLCRVCATFAPINIRDFQNYVSEKVDWKLLDSFRKYGQWRGTKQKKGMEKAVSVGKMVTRAPLGYSIVGTVLVLNKDASKVHSLFRTFLNENYSLNSIAKKFSLSVNGVKGILMNRTYLGEIKFGGKIYKGNHQKIISPEIFYAVQRKINGYLRPRNVVATRF